MDTIPSYIRDCLSELHQVRWPTRQQAVRLSAITIGFTAVTTVAFGMVDYVLAAAVQVLLSLTY